MNTSEMLSLPVIFTHFTTRKDQTRSSSVVCRVTDKHIFAQGCVGRNAGGVWYPYIYRIPIKKVKKASHARRPQIQVVYSESIGSVLSIDEMKKLGFC